MASNKKVIVGMSGGVDSSVAALLLQQQGYCVEGLFMKNWEEDDSDSHCSASIDVADAQQVCDKLGIKLHTVNFAAEYWDRVFEIFLKEYKAGRTPNPDILCNSEIKFKAFLEYALHLGADYIATGHYARTDHRQLFKARDRNKDQSYFLYAINGSALKNTLFPLGDLLKPEIRKIAAAAGFANSAKKDSTGICFIGERKFKKFLNTYLPAQSGNIKTSSGTIIGTHDGLMFYTIGQRQGLGIGGLKEADATPWYVVNKDLQTNTLIVAQGTNNPLLYANSLVAAQLTWITRKPATNTFNATAKIRYRQSDQTCLVKLSGNKCLVEFTEPQRAITNGQSLVLYQGDVCIGGGIITDVP
ncbi:MAG: tRNA 2-thiouridine(34) synthase MnmA [Thiotrichales bacterium]|nr:MAG: tRNA 2-thiouridine(34) synthase MnmA [Thiotrichales bacterium]